MRFFLLLIGLLHLGVLSVHAQPQVTVASKKFTENVILGEIVADLAETTGAVVTHRRELGGTRFLWEALRQGDIDVYPEYTGTIRQEILAGEDVPPDGLEAALARHGIRMTASLGFNNTYALGMTRARSEQLGIASTSDLARHPDLRFGFSNEFMDRADGWPGLRDAYRLPQRAVRGLDHDLAYRGLEGGTIDVIDLYTTDAEIRYYDLQVLRDDKAYFPDYQAVLLYRADLAERAPEVVTQLHRLEGALDEDAMIALNAAARLDREPEAAVAARFVNDTFAPEQRVEAATESRAARLWRHTREHLVLVLFSLAAAILAGIPLGIVAARYPGPGRLILGTVGVIYTIPSLALLVFMIPLLGIGGPPAMVALFLYSLLPIVRNTHAGLMGLPAPLRESAEALGLSARARLLRVELPLATRPILAGIQTSAVINVGTATLGALIGAGGYGQPILTGIRLDDTALILEGAIPAAVLALLAQLLFDGLERALLPAGLREAG